MQITVQYTAQKKQLPPPGAALGFGQAFTDHMFLYDYDEGHGWHGARIVPYGPLALDPSCAALHYGQTIFEGLKCYRRPDGGLQLFRPLDNFERLQRSARRMAMQAPSVADCLEGLTKLLQIDAAWVPADCGTSLYIRPFVIATDSQLGVHPSHRYHFAIILSPVGAYYPQGLKPNDIYIESQYVRAVRGGTGEAKTGGNYSASLLAAQSAQQKGYVQVLWLDGVYQRYVEEVGAMNIFFVYGNHLRTPALNGSILPGITRDSVLRLAQDLGYTAAQEKIDIHELLKDLAAGRITESFGVGTAAVISPVGAFCYGERRYVLGERPGPISQLFYDRLTDIQYGRLSDSYGWVIAV